MGVMQWKLSRHAGLPSLGREHVADPQDFRSDTEQDRDVGLCPLEVIAEVGRPGGHGSSAPLSAALFHLCQLAVGSARRSSGLEPLTSGT